MRRGRRWRGWDLLQRRYSMPEIAMRKYSLSRSGSGSWDSSGTSSCSCRVDRSAQTTPSLGPAHRARSYPERLPCTGDRGVSGASGEDGWGPEDTPSPPAPWTSSSATLSQTVSDRTTSTQDSTLSLPSTTPERPIKLNLDPVIFAPAGGNIVINSEASLIRPLEMEPSRSHFTFGSSDSTPTAEVVSVVSRQVSEVGVNTETDCTESVPDETALPPEDSHEETEPNTERTATYRSKQPSPSTTRRSIGCQAETPEPLTEDPPLSQHTCCDRQARLENEFFGTAIEARSWSHISYTAQRPRVSCTSSCNYKEPPGQDIVIPRYSAVPRTGSMLVNTSSLDYTSDDSDLSLTDSLEDAVERAPLWPSTKHDNRLVRGEVNTHEEINTKKKYIKSKNTYAYFLFLSGEEDVIKEYSLPDKLKTRLKQKEEEIKKHFETKFACFKKPPYRKRKKLKFVRRNSETNSSEPRGSKTVAVKPRAVSKSTQCFEKNSPKRIRRGVISKPIKPDPELDHAIANILMASMDTKNKVTTKRDENWNLKDRRAVTSDVGTSVPDFDTPAPEVSEERNISLIHSCKGGDGEVLEGNNTVSESSVRDVGTETIEIVEQQTQTEDMNREKEEQTQTEDMSREREGQTQTEDMNREKEEQTQTEDMTWEKEEEVQTEDMPQEVETQTEELPQEVETQTEELPQEVETQTEEMPQEVEMVEKASSPVWATASAQTTDSLLESTPEEEENPLNKGIQVSAEDVRGVIEDIRNNNAECSPMLLPQIKIESIGDLSVESLDNGEEEAVGFLTVPDPEAFVRTENDKNVINSLSSSFSKKETCIRNKTAKGIRSNAEILEINVPACTCHMCTFEKMTSSPSARERTEARLAQRSRPSPSPQSSHSGRQQDKRTTKPVPRRNPNVGSKFLQRFEVIPEEKNSSTESAVEELNKPLDLSPQWRRMRDLTPKRVDDYVQTDEIRYMEEECIDNLEEPKVPTRKSLHPENMDHTRFEEARDEEKKKFSRTPKPTRNQVRIPQGQSKRPSVVIGRFKEKELVGDGLIRQYKGRAALANTQEELVTLSKGWINFYLLRDSQDVASDASSPDEVMLKPSEEKLLERRGNEKKEEVMKQYTVEIQATPEPLLVTRKEATTTITGLPDLKTKRLKKREKPNLVTEEHDLVLPDIPSSSSSSSPESVPRLPESPPRLPDLRKEKKTSRNAKKQRREKRSPSPDHVSKNQRLLRLPQGAEPISRAVEIAHSEHSVSSVTSSTVIMSESPPPEKVKLPERRLQRHRQQNTTHTTQQTTCINNTGNSWSVTVAGSSGSSRHPPPDVEMKLSFGNREKAPTTKDRLEQGNSDLVRYGQPQNALRNHTNRTSRQQDHTIEDQVDTSRSEHRPLRCLPDAPSTITHSAKKEKNQKTKIETAREPGSSRVPSVIECSHPLQRNFCRMCRQDQRDSGSENTMTSGCSELQLTGMAITPEMKPRVPTQSERDILRARRYRFT